MADRRGSKAYSVRNGRPSCCVLSSRMWPWAEPLIPVLYGKPNVGPRSSRRRTEASKDSCSSSARLSHHSPNSSVYSTSQIMRKYSPKGIFRQWNVLSSSEWMAQPFDPQGVKCPSTHFANSYFRFVCRATKIAEPVSTNRSPTLSSQFPKRIRPLSFVSLAVASTHSPRYAGPI